MCRVVFLVVLCCLFYMSLGKSVANDKEREQKKRQFLPIPTCSSDYDCPVSHRCDLAYSICIPEQEQKKRQFLPIPTCSSDYDCPVSHRCDLAYNICIPEQGHSNGKRQQVNAPDEDLSLLYRP